MQAEQLPLVDVVVLNHNGKRFLSDCFDSLRATTYGHYRVYLLDNASTADDVAWVRVHYPEVHIIQNPHNNGFCAAYNLALEQCNGKYFICLNNDVKVKPDWISHLVDEAEQDENIGALQCKMVSFFDEHQYEYAGSSGGMLDVYGFPFLRGRVFHEIESDHGQYDNTQQIFWTCGAAMFIRKSVIAQIGNFEETIVHHMDEIDLCWRMHLMDYTCKVVPQSVILHYGGATIQSNSFKKMYWNHRNSLFVVMKNYGPKQAILKSLAHIGLDYLAMANSLIRGKWAHTAAIITAHLWIVLNFFLILEKRKQVQQCRVVSDKVLMQKMYPKSVALQFFLHGRKTYTELIQQIKGYENKFSWRVPERLNGGSARSI